MNKKITRLIVTATLINSGIAMAGAQSAFEVSVGDGWANGTTRGARVSADSNQYIGCTLHSSAGGTSTSAYCSARDKAGKYLSCYTTDVGVVNALKGMSDFYGIYFNIDSTGKCSYLQVGTHSMYLP